MGDQWLLLIINGGDVLHVGCKLLWGQLLLQEPWGGIWDVRYGDIDCWLLNTYCRLLSAVGGCWLWMLVAGCC